MFHKATCFQRNESERTTEYRIKLLDNRILTAGNTVTFEAVGPKSAPQNHSNRQVKTILLSVPETSNKSANPKGLFGDGRQFLLHDSVSSQMMTPTCNVRNSNNQNSSWSYSPELNLGARRTSALPADTEQRLKQLSRLPLGSPQWRRANQKLRAEAELLNAVCPIVCSYRSPTTNSGTLFDIESSIYDNTTQTCAR